jgi:hypothetical protein
MNFVGSKHILRIETILEEETMLSCVTASPRELNSLGDDQRSALKNLNNLVEMSENLYHIIVTISHSLKDPNNQVERLCVVGTYVTLPAAKAAAHRCLFEAGYEKEWFLQYDTHHESSEGNHAHMTTGIVVRAVAQDGTTFQVAINTTRNLGGFMTDNEDGRISHDLWYVLQTNIFYMDDDSGEVRDHNIEGVFRTYGEARKFASGILLDEADGITREKFQEYEEAGADDMDCGYDANVVVRAVGDNGENVLVSVIKGQTMESVRLAEASVLIR